MNEHSNPASGSSDDDTDYAALCSSVSTNDAGDSRWPTVLGTPSLTSQGSASTLVEALQIDAPEAMHLDADLQPGLQWLTNGESPKAMEIPAGATAEDIEREEESEKARLRVWLSSMCQALDCVPMEDVL